LRGKSPIPPSLVFGSLMMLTFVFIGIFGGMLAPHPPLEQSLRYRLLPPGATTPQGQFYLLGTDQLGRDLLSRMLVGARVSLMIGFFSVVLAGLVGTLLGLWAGFSGGIASQIYMRLIDFQMSLPFVLLALAIVGIFGPGLWKVVIALTAWGWVSYGRLAKAITESLREREFIIAARSIGATRRQLLFRHILPNVAPPLIVLASVQVGRMIIAGAGLEFLGLGVPPPAPSWGAILAEGRTYMRDAWWIVTLPGLAILFVAFGANFLGDGLRQLIDPRRLH